MTLLVNLMAVEVDIDEYNVRKEIDDLKEAVIRGVKAFMQDAFPNVRCFVKSVTVAETSAETNKIKNTAKNWNKDIRSRFMKALENVNLLARFHSDQTHALAQAAREMDDEFFPGGRMGLIYLKGYYSVAGTFMTDELWSNIQQSPKEYAIIEMECEDR